MRNMLPRDASYHNHNIISNASALIADAHSHIGMREIEAHPIPLTVAPRLADVISGWCIFLL